MAFATQKASAAEQGAAAEAASEKQEPAQGEADAATPVRLKTCPHCRRAVKVRDPYAGKPPAEQRSSAWFVKHKDVHGNTCIGSYSTAIAREPRPASEDGIDTELEEGLVDLGQILK